MKITAIDEPKFAAAVRAADVLFKFLASHVADVLPPPLFRADDHPCLRPSANMLTSLETVPDATSVPIPPLYDRKPFDAAMRSGHGRFKFSSDNEVLFFGDEPIPDGYSFLLSFATPIEHVS